MCVHSAGSLCYFVDKARSSLTNAVYYDLYYPGGSFLRYGGHGGG